jgi:Domain of unknown function (DUF4440)
MKKLMVILFAFVWITALSQSRQEQEVLQLSKRKFAWLIGKNYDSLNFALDDRLTFIHSNGWVQTKGELIADLKSGKLKYINIEVLEATVRMYPKSAVVTGKGKFSVDMSGATNTYDLTYTETYVLQRREWKLASRHASRAQ